MFIQDIYMRNLMYPFLFGKAPLISALLQPKLNPQPPPLPPSPPETPTALKSFFSNDTLHPVSKLEKAIVHSKELRSKTALDRYKQKGLQWLRRHDSQRYPAILRNPTMGCMIELSSKPTLFTVHIDSKEAKKIIYRECYF